MELTERLLLRHVTRFTFDEESSSFDEISVCKYYDKWSIENHWQAVLCEWRQDASHNYKRKNKYCWNGPGQYMNSAEQVSFPRDEAIHLALDINAGIVVVDPV